jgi:hypothetical protein
MQAAYMTKKYQENTNMMGHGSRSNFGQRMITMLSIVWTTMTMEMMTSPRQENKNNRLIKRSIKQLNNR